MIRFVDCGIKGCHSVCYGSFGAYEKTMRKSQDKNQENKYQKIKIERSVSRDSSESHTSVVKQGRKCSLTSRGETSNYDSQPFQDSFIYKEHFLIHNKKSIQRKSSKNNEERRKSSVENNPKCEKTNMTREAKEKVCTKTAIEVEYLNNIDEKLP